MGVRDLHHLVHQLDGGYAIGGNALLTQNAVLTAINILGIYRWLIWR